MEKHEFVFDAVLNEEVTNDEVTIMWFNLGINIIYDISLLSINKKRYIPASVTIHITFLFFIGVP